MDTKTLLAGISGFKAAVGQPLKPGPWHTVTFADIQRFADATGDHQWIHVDRERIARESPFGAPIAHGYFSLSRIGGLFFETLEIVDVGMVVNYGLNKVRFPAPMKEGSSYRLAMQIDAVKDVEGGAEVLFRCTIEVKDQPKPACVAECVFRVAAPR